MPKFKLLFADWRARPGRTEEWREARRANFPTEDMWRREYPETLEDVLLAAEEGPFPSWAIRQCIDDYPYPVAPIGGVPTHRYLKMWDQGREHDAFVGVVLDITHAPYQLCDYRRLLHKHYQIAQAEVEEVHKRYPGPTYVGDDNASKVIVENLTVPATHFLVGSLKPRCIMATKVALEQGYLSMPGSVTEDNIIISPVSQLIFELESYLWDDKGLVQDSVMALSNALYVAGPPIHQFERPGIKTVQGRSSPLRLASSAGSKRSSRSLPIAASTSRRLRRVGPMGQSDDAHYI